MKANLSFAVVCLIAALCPAKAQQSPAAGIEQLTQWAMEDIARQRLR
jgi:hypothetical protein